MTSIKTERAADQVAQHLESLILEGSLSPGEALLPERELSDRLDVSRSTLRLGLKLLEERGLVVRAENGGLEVAPLGAAGIADPLIALLARNVTVADDYLEFRSVAEGAAAALAAERANEIDRARLRNCLDRITRAHAASDPQEDAEADVELHLMIYEATHNVVLLHVMRAMASLLRTDVIVNRQRLFSVPHTRDLLFKQHVDIATAILQGDASAARAAAHAHIDYLRDATHEIRRADVQLDTSLRRLKAGGVARRDDADRV